MLPYPPPYAQSKTEENQVLRSLGAILALLGAILALLGLIFHQGSFELVFALLIAIFSLRTFILWLGDTQRNQKREPFTPRQAGNSQPLVGSYPPYPPQPGYFIPQQSQSSFYPAATNEMTVPFAPAVPGAPFAPANAQTWLPAQGPFPPPIQQQTQGGFPSYQAHPMPQGSFTLPPPPAQSFAPGQLPASMPSASMSQSLQAPATAAQAYAPSGYAPGQPVQPAPGVLSTAPSPTAAFAQPGQPAEAWQWGQGQQAPQQEGWQQ
jgi:hypothetical protein